MYTLLYGDIWYGKYGFQSYDPYNDMEDKDAIQFYENNQRIITTTKTKDTNLYNYLCESLSGGQKSKNDKKIKQKIDEYYIKYGNLTIDIFS